MTEYDGHNFSSDENIEKCPMMITVKSIASSDEEVQDEEGNTHKIHEHTEKVVEEEVSDDIEKVDKIESEPKAGDEDIG